MIQSDDQFTIRVIVDDDKAKVTIGTGHSEPSFKAWMAACEFFLATVARKSDVGFEKAMELLCSGATTYKPEGSKK